MPEDKNQENLQDFPPDALHPDQSVSPKHERVIVPLGSSLRPEDSVINVAPPTTPQPIVSDMPLSPIEQTPQQISQPTTYIHQPAGSQSVEDDNSKFAWLKIALAGFIIPIAISVSLLVVSLILDLILGAAIRNSGSFSLPIIRFFSPFYLLLLIACAYTYIVLCKRYVSRFSGYAAKRPLLISVSTFIFILLCYVFMIHVTAFGLKQLQQLEVSGTIDHLALRKIIGNIMPFAFPFLSASFLTLFTFLLEKLKLAQKFRLTTIGVILVLPILATILVSPGSSAAPDIAHKSATTISRSGSPNNISSQGSPKALSPSYLPTGTSIEDDGLCSFNNGLTATYNTFCNYTFTYPGYLSKSTQSQILKPQALQDFIDSYGFMSVSEAPYNSFFKPYLYQKGQCDLTNLPELLGIAPAYLTKNNSNVPTPNPTTCIQLTTSGRTKLFAKQDYLNNSLTQTVYLDYYFIKDGTIVDVSILNKGALTNNAAQIMVLDPNFNQQFFKFIDSFGSK